MILEKFTEDLNITFVIVLSIFFSIATTQFIIRKILFSQITEIHVTDGIYDFVYSGYKLIETLLNKYLKINVLITKKKFHFKLFIYNAKTRKLIINDKCYFSKSIINYYKCLLIIAYVNWIHSKHICRIFSRFSFFWTHLITLTVTAFLTTIIFKLISANNGYILDVSGQGYSYYNIFWLFFLYAIIWIIVDLVWKSITILCVKRLWKKIMVENYFSNKEIGFLNQIANVEISTSACGIIVNILNFMKFSTSKIHIKKKRFL